MIDPIAIQRRLAEQGRIRLGQKVPVGTSGKTRPGKLDRFRFTSPNRRLIEDLATLYGGTARPWDNNGIPEFEVVSERTEIPVVVVAGGISQWFETWSGGGCVHRCTGVDDHTDPNNVHPCNLDDPNHRNAKPTTRLSLMLPELDTMGVWRLESHGYNAAAEIPMIAALAEHVGDLVTARLSLVERRKISNGQTSRFVVPVLDLDVNTTRLVELAGGRGAMTSAIGAGSGGQAQIGAAPGAEQPSPPVLSPFEVYGPQIAACDTREQLNTLWQEINEARAATDEVVAAFRERARVVEIPDQAPPVVDETPAEQPDATLDVDDEAEHVDGELIDDDLDTDRAWQDVVAAAGRRGISTTDLVAAFEQWAAVPVSDGDAVMFRRFIAEELS